MDEEEGHEQAEEGERLASPRMRHYPAAPLLPLSVPLDLDLTTTSRVHGDDDTDNNNNTHAHTHTHTLARPSARCRLVLILPLHPAGLTRTAPQPASRPGAVAVLLLTSAAPPDRSVCISCNTRMKDRHALAASPPPLSAPVSVTLKPPNSSAPARRLLPRFLSVLPRTSTSLSMLPSPASRYRYRRALFPRPALGCPNPKVSWSSSTLRPTSRSYSLACLPCLRT